MLLYGCKSTLGCCQGVAIWLLGYSWWLLGGCYAVTKVLGGVA